MDIFDSKNISPMLIAENKEPFDSPEYIYELKLDGIRCIAYLWDTGLELQNKRNKRLNSTYPELKSIYKQAKKRCILDGELVILNNGKPDFYELQRRSLMTNPVKIDLALKKLPVCFTAFDILYVDDKQITELPLLDRKSRLLETIMEMPSFAVSRYIDHNGVALYQAAKMNGLEGIVAKRKDSKYYFGKRTKDWLKMKCLNDDDFVVCGYFQKDEGMISVILGSYENDKLKYQSHVAMGVSHQDIKIITSVQKNDKGYYPSFPEFDHAVWLNPSLVCCVQFMEKTPAGGLRQPVFKGLRMDKAPTECKLKNRL